MSGVGAGWYIGSIPFYRGPVGMSREPCNWVEQCSPECKERAEHANELNSWIHESYEKNEELRRALQADQFDLFAGPADQQMVDLWEGIHLALGQEYRRRSRLFWQSCPQVSAGE